MVIFKPLKNDDIETARNTRPRAAIIFDLHAAAQDARG
jgi:hypothetical protein